MNEVVKDREEKLRNFKVFNPIFPDCVALGKCALLDDMLDYFVSREFRCVFGENPGEFEGAVLEFAYSFKPKLHVVK